MVEPSTRQARRLPAVALEPSGPPRSPANARRRAGPGVRLDDDFPAVLAALRRGLEDNDARKAAAVAISYVQLVYGRQLQQRWMSSRSTIRSTSAG